jgi:hypothetical protein
MIRNLLFTICLYLCVHQAHATSTTPIYRLVVLHAAGWELGYSTAINASGVVAGFAHIAHGEGQRPFTYDNGKYTIFGALGDGHSNANGIND